MNTKLLFTLFMYFSTNNVNALSFPGPQVYVVTPSAKSLQIDEGKNAPFYYHKWMRRMDSTNPVFNTTSTIATPTPTTHKTPDLIFAEFESDGSMQKSIRKLLEKENIALKSTTTQPIYVSEEETSEETANYGLPSKNKVQDLQNQNPMSHMFDEYYNNAPPVVYVPSTSPTVPVTQSSETTTTNPINVENIWHIIDNDKYNQQISGWDEVLATPNKAQTTEETPMKVNHDDGVVENDNTDKEADNEMKVDENFALPGFSTNSGSAAENESRSIRTESNLKFPYINLKPFQMKTMKRPALNINANNKKNNVYNNLNNFYDLKQPVRGEAQDVVPVNYQIDRYNPAQPYLPKPDYGSKVSKQSSPISPPIRATASLVPPPLPPRITSDDFPSPSSYESFPPYLPSTNFGSNSAPKPQSPPSPPAPPQSPPSMDTSIDTDSSDSSDDDSPVMDLGYRYKPPSAPIPQFAPTIPTPTNSLQGYSYLKPSAAPAAPVQQDFMGYHYNKPESSPPMAQMPDFQGYHYKKPDPSPPMDYAQDNHEYGPKKPDIPQFFDHKPASYGSPSDHDDHGMSPPSSDHSDYPDLIFQKDHDDTNGMKDDDMKGNDMGMMPPSPPADMKPDDHGFPSDFPGDFKYHHDFDDHDHDHDHYHYHHTTTTTTTEMPRVNRYSYYYLGKKLYYLPLYFSVYFIIYVGALIIKAVLRHKIVYPNSWRPNDTTASFFSKRSVDEFLSHDNLHEMTGKVTHAIATAAQKYMNDKSKTN